MDDTDEKRQERRARVLREAKIVFNSGASLIDCFIRDEHEEGARLRVPAPTVLPDSFQLLWVADEIIREAETAWRRGDDLGVRFVGPPKPAPHRYR